MYLVVRVQSPILGTHHCTILSQCRRSIARWKSRPRFGNTRFIMPRGRNCLSSQATEQLNVALKRMKQKRQVGWSEVLNVVTNMKDVRILVYYMLTQGSQAASCNTRVWSFYISYTVFGAITLNPVRFRSIRVKIGISPFHRRLKRLCRTIHSMWFG